MNKKLYLGDEKKICGVCSGIAEYLNVDVTIIRLLFVLCGLWGSGVLLYIIAACIIPPKPLN